MRKNIALCKQGRWCTSAWRGCMMQDRMMPYCIKLVSKVCCESNPASLPFTSCIHKRVHYNLTGDKHKLQAEALYLSLIPIFSQNRFNNNKEFLNLNVVTLAYIMHPFASPLCTELKYFILGSELEGSTYTVNYCMWLHHTSACKWDYKYTDLSLRSITLLRCHTVYCDTL